MDVFLAKYIFQVVAGLSSLLLAGKWTSWWLRSIGEFAGRSNFCTAVLNRVGFIHRLVVVGTATVLIIACFESAGTSG